MAKTAKKSPTIFYWLSLLSAAGIIVMMFLNWFTFQVTSFNEAADANLNGSYGLAEIGTFLTDAHRYVQIEGDSWIPLAATIAMYTVVALQGIYILWALITIRRTPPRGILSSAVALVVSVGFLVAHALLGSYILQNQVDEYDHIEFFTSACPYIVIMLAVATVVFALLNRQESRALYAVKHPRAFVFPPQNPEPV